MKIIIISDAWKPQVNGVVNSLNMTCIKLREIGHKIEVIGPDKFKTFPCPSYPSIKLSLFPKRKLLSIIDEYKPDSIHIATEGPLGQAARKICLNNKWRFTTSYHTQFPEYIKARIPIPLSISYFFLKRFHSKAEKTLVPTKSMAEKLKDKGFKNGDLPNAERFSNNVISIPLYPSLNKKDQSTVVEKLKETFLEVK